MITDAGNNPYLKRDCYGNPLQDSAADMTFRGTYDGSSNLIYKAFARPGADESSLVWQITLQAYTGTNLISIKYPQDSYGHASSEYGFSWTDRASYTYS